MTRRTPPEKNARKCFYGGRYIIALYDYDTTEICYGVFGQAQELADFLGATVAAVHCALSRAVHHAPGSKRQDGIMTPLGKARPYLIEMTPEEIREELRL